MSTPFFSIIIPVYNVEQYVAKCLDSVLSQTFTDYEVIIVDDGSTDSSGSICDKYASDHRFIVIHQNNHGASSARNCALRKAKGEYVLFLDSDDFWASNDLLSTLNHRITLTNPDVLSFNYYKSTGDSISSPIFKCATMPIELLQTASFEFQTENGIWTSSLWTKSIKRIILINNDMLFTEGVVAEDIDWCARLALYANDFDYINITGLVYLQRGSSVSKSFTAKNYIDTKNNILKTIEFVDKAECKKRELLLQYLSYQIGTLVYILAKIDTDHISRKEFVKEITPLVKYLNYSKQRKIKILRFCISILGINNTLRLLKVKH